jgi:hypothetical protein
VTVTRALDSKSVSPEDRPAKLGIKVVPYRIESDSRRLRRDRLYLGQSCPNVVGVGQSRNLVQDRRSLACPCLSLPARAGSSAIFLPLPKLVCRWDCSLPGPVDADSCSCSCPCLSLPFRALKCQFLVDVARCSDVQSASVLISSSFVRLIPVTFHV